MPPWKTPNAKRPIARCSGGCPQPQQNDLLFWATNYLLAALAAATILLKRGSPRKSSQHGLKRKSPYVGIGTPEYSNSCGDPGIVATISSCSSARARSPVHA